MASHCDFSQAITLQGKGGEGRAGGEAIQTLYYHNMQLKPKVETGPPAGAALPWPVWAGSGLLYALAITLKAHSLGKMKIASRPPRPSALCGWLGARGLASACLLYPEAQLPRSRALN